MYNLHITVNPSGGIFN